MPAKPKTKIDPASMGQHLEHLGGGKMAVPTDEEMGSGPAPPQRGQEPNQDHGVFSPRGMCARAQAGSHQRLGGAFENKQWEIAIAPVVMVIEREFLLAMGRVIGVIKVEHNGGGGRGVTGDKVVDERLREPVDIFAQCHTVLEPGEGRGACQVLRGFPGGPLHAELKQGVVPEAIRIIAVGIPGGNLVDPIRKEVPEGVVDIRRMPLVLHSSGKAFGQANLAVDTPQYERSKMG